MREGAARLADGDRGKAAGVLDDALALWHGPALADLPDRTAERPPLGGRADAEARRTRLTAALALGRRRAVPPRARPPCRDAHPLDEPLQALRLRALRDAGRPAEALAGYEDVRRALADRLGTDPARNCGPCTRSCCTPRPRRPDDRAQAPAPRPGAPPRQPPRPAHLLRRPRRRIWPSAATSPRARLVTLLGPGGAGKTRLSQEAAERRGRDMAGRGVARRARARRRPGDRARGRAHRARRPRDRAARRRRRGAAGGRPTADDPLARLAEHCARRRMLLLLDNCEHVVDAAARLAERLLNRCPGVTRPGHQP